MYRLRFVIGALATFAASLSAQNSNGGIASFNAHRYADARRELDAAVRVHPDDAGA